MKTQLIKKVTLVQKGHPLHLKSVNLLLENGILKEISEQAINTDADIAYDANGAFMSAGWVDLLCMAGYPGEEWKEDLESLTLAASAGGYTHVALLSGTDPLPYYASAIQSLKQTKNGVEIMPLGLPSHKGAGQDLSEIYDMYQSGAVGFFNGENLIEDLGLLRRILEYAQVHSFPIFVQPGNSKLAAGGTVHEGNVHVTLGLKGIPEMAETTYVDSVLQIAAYLKTPVHFTRISAAKSIELIQNANIEGVTCAVPVMNLMYDENALSQFEENFKTNPVLRSAKDKAQLIAFAKEGKINAVISNHQPLDTESKKVEFEYAEFGAATIQHTFNMLCEALGADIDATLISELLSNGPRNVLHMENSSFEIGKPADFTFFDLQDKTKVVSTNNYSKGVNNPVMNCTLHGKVLGTIHADNFTGELFHKLALQTG